MHRNDDTYDVIRCSGTGIFKGFESFMLLRSIIVIQKWDFWSVSPKLSSDKMTWCNNNDKNWFSDTLTCARPLVVGKSTLGVQQMLMHRKACLIPIVVYRKTGKLMTSIIILHKIRESLDNFTPKMQLLRFF